MAASPSRIPEVKPTTTSPPEPWPPGGFEVGAMPGMSIKVSDGKKNQTEGLLPKPTQAHRDGDSSSWLPRELSKPKVHSRPVKRACLEEALGISNFLNVPNENNVQPRWGSIGQGQRFCQRKLSGQGSTR